MQLRLKFLIVQPEVKTVRTLCKIPAEEREISGRMRAGKMDGRILVRDLV